MNVVESTGIGTRHTKTKFSVQMRGICSRWIKARKSESKEIDKGEGGGEQRRRAIDIFPRGTKDCL